MKISVVVVTRNAAATLRETLESVAAQTHRDVEIVAIDGASTDGTQAVFERHRPLVATLVSEPDTGVYNAMNKALRHVRGEIVYFLNAQDTLHAPDVLAHIARAFTHDRTDVVFGDIHFTNRSGIEPRFLRVPPDTVRRYADCGYDNPSICHQAIFYRRKLFDQLGGYDERFRVYADFDFNIRAFIHARGAIRYVPRVVADFDLGGISTLADYGPGTALQSAEHVELTEKFRRMHRRAGSRDFLFHWGPSRTGGAYVQLGGFRFDWSAWRQRRLGVRPGDGWPLELRCGSDDNGSPDPRVRLSGFNAPEPWGAWTAEENAALTFVPGDIPAEGLRLTVAARPLLHLRSPDSTYGVDRTAAYGEVRVNGHAAGALAFDAAHGHAVAGRATSFSFPVPAAWLRGRAHNRVDIVSETVCPEKLGSWADPRNMGLGLFTLNLEPLDADDAGGTPEFVPSRPSPPRATAHYPIAPEAWGAWLGKGAFFHWLPARTPSSPLRLAFEFRVATASAAEVLVNGASVARWTFAAASDEAVRRAVEIPAGDAGPDHPMTVAIRCDGPDIAYEGDPRFLGVGLIAFRIRKAGADD